jgi:hypothetical protein
MNKLLVTGMAIGQDAGVCDVCDYDLDWLINYPSILLWADRIIITETVWQVIQKKDLPGLPELAKACKLIFDIARDQGIVEIVQPTPLLRPGLSDAIFTQVDNDLDKIKRLFPDKVVQRSISKPGKEGPNETLIDGVGFCEPYISSIYASLVLAKAWEANCLFDPRVIHYLRYKFGIEAFPKQADNGRIQSFTTVFESYFPNEPLIPGYVFDSQGRCLDCQNEKKCKGTYLKDLETKTLELLKWREYDEIQQAKAVVDKIIVRRDKSDIVDPHEVAKEFNEEQSKLTKRVRSIFPKAKRWANVTTIVSIPLAIAGLSSGEYLVTLAGATAAGLAQVGKQYVEFLESKYRWVGFLQNIQGSCPDRETKGGNA